MSSKVNFTHSKLPVAIFYPTVITVILLFTNFPTEYFFVVKRIVNSYSVNEAEYDSP